MKTIFSARTRSTTWRKLWIMLAEGEKQLGLDISDEAITQMKEHVEMTDHDFKIAAEEERIRRHDVMAHVHAFGQVAPVSPNLHIDQESRRSQGFGSMPQESGRLEGPGSQKLLNERC